MRYLKYLGIGLVVLPLLYGIHEGVNALTQAHGWKGLNPQDWAAWIQALGSIAAIWAGFRVANRQAREAKLLAHHDYVQAGNERLDAILTAATFASDALDAALVTTFEKPKINVYHRNSGDYLNATVALDSIPLLELGSAEVIRSVFRIRHCMSELNRFLLNSSNPEYVNTHDREEFQRAIEEIRADKNQAYATIKAEIELARVRLLQHL